MNTKRIKSVSDGVFAIIITIMILDLKIPKDYDWQAIAPAIYSFVVYIASFLTLGIYWNNHYYIFY